MRPKQIRQALFAALLILSLLLTSCGESHKFAGDTKLPPIDLSSYELSEVHTDAPGGPYALHASPGSLMVVYLGYTNCPDECPTTLVNLGRVRTNLGKLATRVDVAFVTVDPVRDTPPVLSGYLDRFNFGRNGHALRAVSDSQLTQLGHSLFASVQITNNADGTTSVGHTDWCYIVDDRGKVVDEWSYGMTPPQMTSDLRLLLNNKTKAAQKRPAQL